MEEEHPENLLFISLCNPCTVTKDLIREVMNEEHPENLLFFITLPRIFTMVNAFCRFGVTDLFTMDGA